MSSPLNVLAWTPGWKLLCLNRLFSDKGVLRPLRGAARAQAAKELAAVIETHPAAAESLRFLLAKDWMVMGEKLGNAPAGSLLMVDPQGPSSLLAALKGLQEKG